MAFFWVSGWGGSFPSFVHWEVCQLHKSGYGPLVPRFGDLLQGDLLLHNTMCVCGGGSKKLSCMGGWGEGDTTETKSWSIFLEHPHTSLQYLFVVVALQSSAYKETLIWLRGGHLVA